LFTGLQLVNTGFARGTYILYYSYFNWFYVFYSLWMNHMLFGLCIHIFKAMCCFIWRLHKKALLSLCRLWTGAVRASSLFPILSTVLLMVGGLCVGVGRIYNNKNNILLTAGILFVAAGITGLTAPPSDEHTNNNKIMCTNRKREKVISRDIVLLFSH